MSSWSSDVFTSDLPALFALVHCKCAYFEARYDTTAPVDIVHFRPKAGIVGTRHLGYWWFAATWSNLLPSCIDCNRKREHPTPREFSSLTAILDERLQKGFTPLSTGKGTCFPIEKEEDRIVAEPSPSDIERLLKAAGADRKSVREGKESVSTGRSRGSQDH